MRANALRCMANTHKEEGSDRADGGWQQWPGDKGNWVNGINYGTKFGIAAHTAKIRGIHPREIRTLTREKADALYMAYEWPKSWGDDWPMGFDQITYDATVNSGPGRGPLWTCRALGFANDKNRIAAVTKAKNLSTNEKVAAIKRAVSGQRMSFLRGLRDWSEFGNGWGPRCARMEALGIKMVLEEAKVKPAEQTKRLEKESEQAKSTSNKAGAGAAGGTAAGGGATQVGAPSDTIDWIIAGGVTLAVVGTVVACIWIWWKHRERAKAYIQVAKGYYDDVRAKVGV